jgi:hypothetical protein
LSGGEHDEATPIQRYIFNASDGFVHSPADQLCVDELVSQGYGGVHGEAVIARAGKGVFCPAFQFGWNERQSSGFRLWNQHWI